MSQPFYLAPICDVHFGSPRTQYKRLEEWIRTLADRNDAVAFGLGDLCDLIGHMDPRFTAGVIDTEVYGDVGSFATKQVDSAAKALRPLVDAGKLAFVTQGNHEMSCAKRGYVDPHALMLEKLGATTGKTWHLKDPPLDGGLSFLLRIVFVRGLEKRVFSVYGHHGFFGGQTPNKVRHLSSLVRLWDVDLVVTGHGHTPVDTGPIQRLRPNQRWESLDERPARGIMCCAWKHNMAHDHISWEETRGFQPAVVGPTLIKIVPGARTITPLFGVEAEIELRKQ